MGTKLGEWVFRARERKRLSQRQLAELARVSQSTIQSIEANDHVPKAPVLVALAQALGQSPESVLRIAGILPPKAEARDPHFEVLETLWDMAPDWKKRDIVMQLRAALEEQERERAQLEGRRREGQTREETGGGLL